MLTIWLTGFLITSLILWPIYGSYLTYKNELSTQDGWFHFTICGVVFGVLWFAVLPVALSMLCVVFLHKKVLVYIWKKLEQEEK